MPPMQAGCVAMDLEELRVLKADQKAKLLCFCTGPAIYHPPLNWLCEFMSSLIFVRTWTLMLCTNLKPH